MANICTTTIKLIMTDKNASKLKSLLMDEELQHFDCDVSVSTIYKEFGIEPNKNTHLRASWSGYEIETISDGRVIVSVLEEAAWNPSQLALQLKEEGFADSFYFYAEEPGNEIFCTNDVEGIYFPNRWHVYYVGNEEDEQFENHRDALAHINKTLNRHYKTLMDVDESEDVYIHPIEIVDDTEL